MNPILFIASSIVVGAVAQLVLKSGAKCSSGGGLLGTFTRPATVVGLALNGVAAALWIVALRFVDLSYAFPWLSLNFILVPVGAAIFLGERLDGGKAAGMLTIAAGVAIVAIG